MVRWKSTVRRSEALGQGQGKERRGLAMDGRPKSEVVERDSVQRVARVRGVQVLEARLGLFHAAAGTRDVDAGDVLGGVRQHQHLVVVHNRRKSVRNRDGGALQLADGALDLGVGRVVDRSRRLASLSLLSIRYYEKMNFNSRSS